LAGHLAANLRPALTGLVLLTIVTGCLFPLALFGIGWKLFPGQAGGSLIVRNGIIVGSALIGQGFSAPRYFHPRPSAAGDGYDATASGGTNFGPDNAKFHDAVVQFAQAFRTDNGLAPSAPIPVDAVTSSGSGLDPHITSENAALQVPRVAHARGMSEAAVRALVDAHTEGRQFGFLGQLRVSVLALNMALDESTSVAEK
jgi:K+-transporting ATPase ATPase C chain